MAECKCQRKVLKCSRWFLEGEMKTGVGRTAKALWRKWQVHLALRTGKIQQVAMGGDNVRWKSTGHSQETDQFSWSMGLKKKGNGRQGWKCVLGPDGVGLWKPYHRAPALFSKQRRSSWRKWVVWNVHGWRSSDNGRKRRGRASRQGDIWGITAWSSESLNKGYGGEKRKEVADPDSLVLGRRGGSSWITLHLLRATTLLLSPTLKDLSVSPADG